jgi:hypothetical protein
MPSSRNSPSDSNYWRKKIMKSRIQGLTAAVVSIAFTGVMLCGNGCSSTGTPRAAATPVGTASAKQPLETAGAKSKAGGAQLWARNCGHCHNIRTPTFYSDAQWEVVLFHMRVRANLTAEEHKEILAFLKSAH